MKTEEKIYSLMVQAEDMQAHAEKLQNGVQETFEGLPLAVEQAGKKIRSTGLLGGLIVLSVGMVVSVVAFASVRWVTSSLRDEAAELRKEVTILKAQVKEFNDKAGKAELTTCNGRLCIRVDKQAVSYTSQNGGQFMIIHGY